MYGATAPPRSTDRAVMSHDAREREIHERFARGVSAEDRADWSAAAQEFTRIVALDPSEPRGSTARYDLALADANLGHDDDAVVQLRAALARDHGFAAAAANLVTLELRRGNIAGAREAAERLSAIAPTSARARYATGLAALRGGDLVAARSAFAALSASSPSYAMAHYDLAVVSAREGRDADAATELQTALDLSPGYARARFALGTVLLRQGKRTEARAAFDRCVRDASDPELRALATDLRDRI